MTMRSRLTSGHVRRCASECNGSQNGHEYSPKEIRWYRCIRRIPRLKATHLCSRGDAGCRRGELGGADIDSDSEESDSFDSDGDSG